MTLLSEGKIPGLIGTAAILNCPNIVEKLHYLNKEKAEVEIVEKEARGMHVAKDREGGSYNKRSLAIIINYSKQ